MAKHRILAELNGLIGIGKTKLKDSYFTDKNLKNETNSATLEGDIKLGINMLKASLGFISSGYYVRGIYKYQNFTASEIKNISIIPLHKIISFF